jgi:thymidine phosphorylase
VTGMLFLVVGSSGVGKDSILDGARIALAEDARFVFARRVITRRGDAGGEDFCAVTPEQFEKLAKEKAFLAQWEAHGLLYGLPVDLLDSLRAGCHVIANASRAALPAITAAYRHVIIVEITASRETLAKRLRARGRETAEDIAARLNRAVPDYPDGVDVISISNDGNLNEATEQFAAAILSGSPKRLKLKRVPIDSWHENICFLHKDSAIFRSEDYLGSGKVDVFNDDSSIRAKVNVVSGSNLIQPDEIGLCTGAFHQLGLSEGVELTIERTPSPESLSALRIKIAGGRLTADQIDLVIRDIAENRYNGREISAFLVSASENLDLDELEALSRSRANHAEQIKWPYELVVDKHSMGGVPGSRITMIVIPIIAAYGMVIPKTSSRAITSAAGTADAMEVIARVDLSADEVRQVVDKTNGCIAWNGRLNHSSVDDVMNAITRPLGINSTKLAVASILSKKLAAGSTHVVIDIPAGVGLKSGTREEAAKLAVLFEEVGARLGLTVVAKVTDGSGPIGYGIGPALEVRDVYHVLNGADGAPAALREKAIEFAGVILEWHSSIPPGEGRTMARKLLESGAASAAFEKITDAQGRHENPAMPGALVHEVRAKRSGKVEQIEGLLISGIARRAGAPMDKSAGVDLVINTGRDVRSGDVLFKVHGSIEVDFHAAVDLAESTDAIKIV